MLLQQYMSRYLVGVQLYPHQEMHLKEKKNRFKFTRQKRNANRLVELIFVEYVR